ncbi:MAG: hypothetical protein OXC91_13660 [Rhodobacteraceae bacterium]|nr:hypothetical protein [Paracoccaceae bacterium]
MFVSTLFCLFIAGSNWSCQKWMAEYAIKGIKGLQLHHLHQTMTWLGEALEPVAASGLAPRCLKDAVDDRLFERRRNLFRHAKVQPRTCPIRFFLCHAP